MDVATDFIVLEKGKSLWEYDVNSEVRVCFVCLPPPPPSTTGTAPVFSTRSTSVHART